MNVADERLQLSLPGTPSSVGAARAFVRGALRGWHLDELVDTVTLLTSELATNAVLHARTPFVLLVERAGSAPRACSVRVTVYDDSDGRPRQRGGGLEATTGRGLALVAALAEAWGTTRPGVRPKGVWFELPQAFDDGGVLGHSWAAGRRFA